MSDVELLLQFIRTRDAAAFALIVGRHERMVFGVALRHVSDRHLAEDVFQATFLVLAENASRVRKLSSLASWLHGTARRIALRALADGRRRAAARLPMDIPTTEELEGLRTAFEQQALDEELAQMPNKYREPLTLHYLEGLTARDVAERLGMTVDTVDGRLRRGRDELRRRLLRRGIAFSTTLGVIQIASQSAAAETMPALTASATNAAVTWAANQPLSACSANAVRLAGKEIAAMSSAKIGVAIATTGVMCLSLGFVAAQIDGGSNASGPKSVQTAILDDPQFLAQGGSESEIILLADVSAPKSAAPVDPASPQTGAPETKPGGPLDANAPSNQQSVRQTAVKAKFADRPLSRSTGGILNYRQRSSAEQKVEAALEQVSPVQFKETPLHDVVQFLSEFHHIPILIDLQHVSESGVALDMPVTISLDDLPLVNVLDLILEDLALTYVVEHGVLRITSQEHASNRMETVLYELRHIESAGMGPDDIYRVLSTTLADEWTENAGPGSLDVIPGAIVVRASQKTHREIANFLKQLEQFAERNDLGPPTPLPPRQRPPDGAAGGGFWSM